MHTHTVRSDGNDAPLELLENAASAGLKVVAITDHDTPPPLTVTLEGGREVSCAEYARERDVLYIPGYEFSCDTQVDDVHICGYGLHWDSPALAAEVKAARESKSNAYKELCRILDAKGMPLDWQRDILRTGTAGERTDDEVERKHIFEAMAARGYCPTWSDAKILVRDDPALNVKRRKIDPVAAIELIHECGGMAILAHPHLIDEEVAPEGLGTMSREQYVERLIAAGLDGIEASYTYDKTSYKGSLTPEQIEDEVRGRYGARLLMSGGSDYHAGHKKGQKAVRNLGERGLSMAEFEGLNLRGGDVR
jgi:predicted metal-dependent phosphoesterase TrpH